MDYVEKVKKQKAYKQDSEKLAYKPFSQRKSSFF
jgi:hypothetical protein